jgi:DNA-binding protein YbaB
MEKAQENWAKAQSEIENLRFEGTADNGGIHIVLTGKFKVEKVDIQPATAQKLATDAAGLSAEISKAFNSAVEKAETYFQEQIGAAMQQLESDEKTEDAPPMINPRLGAARPEMKG